MSYSKGHLGERVRLALLPEPSVRSESYWEAEGADSRFQTQAVPLWDLEIKV